MGSDGKPVELGRGAMGITYKASDTTLRRQVALKVISSRLLHNESLKNRFLREARAAASLRHPYVASIYYLGSTEASYFYAMELIEGQTLEAYIAQHGPLDIKLALEIAVQITSALAAAHQAGLVHRDIKPANIILTRENQGQLTAKVIDFGLVKLTTGDIEESSASEPGIFLGTPRYASPEQISCGQVDIRSDLYSVGVTLWQMLTKSAPFIGTPSEVAAQHLQAPLPISKLKYFPQPLVALLTHLLEKDPKDRPQTPDDLLAVLRATQRSLLGNRALQTRVPVSSDQRKRNPQIAGVLNSIPCRVVNRPAAIYSNRSKPYQALIIRQFGFKIPKTLVTNDPEAARRFYVESREKVIFKSISGVRSVVRYMNKDDLGRLTLLEHGPTQFQEYVPGDNIRVHVVGEHVFAVRIQCEAVDYRYAGAEGYARAMVPEQLPEALAFNCIRLTKELGLAMSGIDLKEAPAGEHFCFEVNASPAFPFYESLARPVIADALAAFLAAKNA